MSPSSENETDRQPLPAARSGRAGGALRVLVAEGRRAAHGAWLAALEGPLGARGLGLEVVAVEALARPTPERRHRRLAALREDQAGVGGLLLVEPSGLPLEALVGALAAGRPAAVVDDRGPMSEPAPFHPGPGPPEPSPALAAHLARAAVVGLPRLDPRRAPDELASALAALCAAPPRAAAASPDPDLLAAAFALEEQYRRLADWTVDLAEHGADLERGGPTPFRRLRRRLRRFLRKRGLR